MRPVACLHFGALAQIAARISNTILTARSRNSLGYFRCAGLAPVLSKDQTLQDHQGGPKIFAGVNV
jgi:hypothetical protein